MIHAHEPFAVTNIGELVTNDPTFGDGLLGVRSNAAVIIDHGLITWVGSSSDVDRTIPRVDMQGRAMLPGFVDSHAHLVFAGDRAGEFAARMQGQPYTAGGIASTVEATRAATTDHLRMNLARRMQEMRACGVTTVETKSGYGLTIADEVRLLELSGEVSQETTFLGAHVVPAGITVDDYVEQVCGPMLVRPWLVGSTCSARPVPSTSISRHRYCRPVPRLDWGFASMPTNSDMVQECSWQYRWGPHPQITARTLTIGTSKRSRQVPR